MDPIPEKVLGFSFWEVLKMYKLNPLRLARLKMGITQYEAALKSGIAQSEISLFERDLRFPRADQIEALADCYRVNPSELLDRQEVCVQTECRSAGAS